LTFFESCMQPASRLLSISYRSIVGRAAYTTGGIIDVGQPTPKSHPEVNLLAGLFCGC
jgi:hypothetical protein